MNHEASNPGPGAGAISLHDVSKTFRRADGSSLPVLEGLEMTVGDGEFVSIIGPSGSGKSTLLYIIAGLEAPTAGTVEVGGRVVRGPDRERGVVFQEDAIFPWLTVRRNVEYGLRLRRMASAERASRVDHYLDLVGLAAFADAYPKELSGGMKKRVAIAAVLANGPRALLLDEPFGPLDYVTTIGLQEELASIWEAEKKTAINVTHDVEEALFLSDRVVVLRDGRIAYETAVPFRRPRRHQLRDSPEFVSLKARLWREIAPHSVPGA
jgi:NitT/TauT family transport system ATP-binding protein